MAAPRSPPLPLAGKVAIVTGASRGIGRAIAIHLSSLGANLILNYYSSSAQAALLAAEINSNSPAAPTAVPVQADVSDPTAARSLFDAAERSFGSPVHILIHNAAICDPACPSVASTSLESFDSVVSTNARGAFLCLREAANRIARGGRIVAVTSLLASCPQPGYGAYAASKAAVEAMTKILAKELKGTGTTANCVAPGPIATDMFFAGRSREAARMAAEAVPFGGLGEVDDVAPVIGFLCRDEAEWVNGQVIGVNGGYV